MTARTAVGIAVGCAVAAFVLMSPALADDPCSKCGWTPHWVGTCTHIDPADYSDDIPYSAVTIGIDLPPQSCTPDTEMVFAGPFIVLRQDPSDDSSNFPGTRPIDGYLDVIDMEITDMSLTAGDGTTLVAGEGLGQGGVLPRSPGVIAELTDNNELAEAYFHVYFEIDLGGGVYGYNYEPLILIAMESLHCVPPDIVFAAAPETCLPVYDLPGGGGTQIAWITFSGDFIPPEHDPYVPVIPTVSQWGLLIMTLLLLTAGTIIFRKTRKAMA